MLRCKWCWVALSPSVMHRVKPQLCTRLRARWNLHPDTPINSGYRHLSRGDGLSAAAIHLQDAVSKHDTH